MSYVTRELYLNAKTPIDVLYKYKYKKVVVSEVKITDLMTVHTTGVLSIAGRDHTNGQTSSVQPRFCIIVKNVDNFWMTSKKKKGFLELVVISDALMNMLSIKKACQVGKMN